MANRPNGQRSTATPGLESAPDAEAGPAAGTGLRERKKRQTRKRIRESAIALFVERGFNATTVEAIAAAAEVSRPTFFNYFSSKLAILHELIETTDRQFVQFIEEELEKPASTAQRLHALMTRSADYLGQQPEFTRLTLVERLGAIADPDAARARFSRLHEAMSALLGAGVQQGDVRGDYSTELMVRMLVGGYLYSILDWLAREQDDLRESIAETAAFLAAAVAPPARGNNKLEKTANR